MSRGSLPPTWWQLPELLKKAGMRPRSLRSAPVRVGLPVRTGSLGALVVVAGALGVVAARLDEVVTVALPTVPAPLPRPSQAIAPARPRAATSTPATTSPPGRSGQGRG